MMPITSKFGADDSLKVGYHDGVFGVFTVGQRPSDGGDVTEVCAALRPVQALVVTLRFHPMIPAVYVIAFDWIN